jgi:hypothetical protein
LTHLRGLDRAGEDTLLRRLILIFSLAAVPAFAETAKGEIDWTRRVLIGHGQGAPDLNAPSIAVARLGAERAAKLDAYRNALETLKGMQLQSGGSVGTLLQNDATLTSRVDGELKGVKPIKTHYYSDGGVSLDIEVPLDELPPDLAKAIKVPGGVAPLTGAGGGAPATPGKAAPGGDVLVQTAQGQAAMLGGDKPAAREKAIEDALRHAVEMAVGTKVTSTSEVQDFQSKMDQVLMHSQGFVKRYDIVKEGMDGEVVQVTVRAEISNADLDKDLQAMGLLMSRKGMPRTMVLIAEQNIGMAAPAAAWMKGGQSALVSADLRIAENTILDQLRSGGFRQLIDPEIATEKAAQVGGITTELNASQARKLKSLTGAEVILIGQVIATSRGEMADLGPGWRSCTATISGRAVNTDNGDILATDETTQNALQLDDLTCGKEAIKKASKVFSQDMIKKIGARWSQDVSGGNEIHVTVHKVSGFKQASDFRSALTQHVRGVKGVSQRSFSGGTQELDVTLVGSSTDQFAQEVEAKKLGKFSVKVTGVTANTVDLELGQ